MADEPGQPVRGCQGALQLPSKLVHGGHVNEKELRKIIGRLSTVPADATERSFGIAIGDAVDSIRDVIRSH
jgi:hypothetical protein